MGDILRLGVKVAITSRSMQVGLLKPSERQRLTMRVDLGEGSQLWADDAFRRLRSSPLINVSNALNLDIRPRDHDFDK